MTQPQEKINHIARNTVIDRTLINPNAIPRELWNYRQFVCWRYEPVPDSKPLKVPVNAKTLGNAGPGWKNTWSDIRTAVATYKANEHLAGIGFVLTSGDPYVGIDLDDCLIDGVLSPLAAEIVNRIPTYTEITPSNQGIRLFIRCPHSHTLKKQGVIEIYSHTRFLTLTGNVFQDRPIANVGDLEWLVSRYPKPPSTPTPPADREGHISSVPADDEALWQEMFACKKGALIKRLYDGVTTDYPSHSEADGALCSRLKFFTGNDLDRVDRMFRRSGLYRDKWDKPDRKYGTYGARTIARARSTQIYRGKAAR